MGHHFKGLFRVHRKTVRPEKQGTRGEVMFPEHILKEDNFLKGNINMLPWQAGIWLTNIHSSILTINQILDFVVAAGEPGLIVCLATWYGPDPLDSVEIVVEGFLERLLKSGGYLFGAYTLMRSVFFPFLLPGNQA